MNRHSALECNKLLDQTGGFWQRESYDHCVRDEEELEQIVAYIHGNPVVPKLAERPEDYPSFEISPTPLAGVVHGILHH